MTTIVHTADLHLDSPLQNVVTGGPGAAREATREAVVRLVEAVLAERADALLIAGDVWDRDHLRAGTVGFFRERMGVLHDAGVPVFVVDGNHDACHPERMEWPLPPNMHWFGPSAAGTRILDGPGVAVHGRGQPAPRVTEDLTPGYPAPVPGMLNIGMLHTSLDRRFGGAVCAPAAPEALAAKGYQYWALGHVHQRAVVEVDPWIVYPGNPQGRYPGEHGPKTATVITAEGGRVAEVRTRELAVVRWERVAVDCSAAGDTDAALDLARAALKEAAEALAPGQRLAAELTVRGLPGSRRKDLAAALHAEAGGFLLTPIRAAE